MFPSPALSFGTRKTLRRAAAAAVLMGATCFSSIATAEPTVRGRTPDGYTVRVDGQRADARRGPSAVRQDRAPAVIPARTGSTADYGSDHFCPG
jgi:hypothetical protein